MFISFFILPIQWKAHYIPREGIEASRFIENRKITYRLACLFKTLAVAGVCLIRRLSLFLSHPCLWLFISSPLLVSLLFHFSVFLSFCLLVCFYSIFVITIPLTLSYKVLRQVKRSKLSDPTVQRFLGIPERTDE
jgi:hypothetical protein